MTRLLCVLLLAFLLSAIPNTNAALSGRDVVWQWHEYFATFMTPGPFLCEFREAALLHLAATDAVNSQTNLYTTYYTYTGAGGSPNANSLNLPHLRAIAIGAYRRMFILNTQSRPAAYGAQAGAKFWNSTQQANMIAGANALYASQINQFPNPTSARVNNSLDYGDQVANWVYNRRVNDGFLLNGTFMGCNRLTNQCYGQWWTPFPGGAPWAQYANITLFSGKAKGFYRVPRPSVDLKVTNNSMQVTMQYGKNVSSVRTASQAQVARYFVFSSQPMMLPQVIKMYSEQQDIKISALTRILALFSITQQDVGAVHLENKFFYNLWRPWHHLNYPQSLNYDTDYFNNNINTPNGNLGWVPYMITPPNPEYPAGHPMMTASGAQIIRRIFGDSTFPVTVGINFVGLLTGENFTDFFYNSLYEYEHEVLMARIWGGMHTHVSCVKGQQLGHLMADDIVESILLPTGVTTNLSEDD